jgi:hypothetical protein
LLRSTPFTPLLSLPLVMDTEVRATVSPINMTTPQERDVLEYLRQYHASHQNQASFFVKTNLDLLEDTPICHPENDQWGSSATVLIDPVQTSLHQLTSGRDTQQMGSYQRICFNRHTQCLHFSTCPQTPHSQEECISHFVLPSRSRSLHTSSAIRNAHVQRIHMNMFGRVEPARLSPSPGPEF